MRPAIRVEHLSKRYRLSVRGTDDYRTLRESLVAALKAPWARRRPAAADDPATLWALNDVSFEIAPGTVVGIIGRNGSGKSTLLKVLSRVTEPTAGRAVIGGRVGSLLEVGTGFHPELSGRENIYLNGAILGMSRREIARKFDEIVAFAEIERFLDTPVKRYSSGMYVRLAFAVAAHLEPEILVVDEVLAVGDQAFQRKCLGKMSEISRSDRTVLFVSHNMAAVQNLCRQVAVLDHGRLTYFGETAAGIKRYVAGGEAFRAEKIDLAAHPNRRPGKAAHYRRLWVRDDRGAAATQVPCGGRLTLEIEVAPPNGRHLHYGAWVEDAMGTRLFTVGTHLTESELPPEDGPRRLRCDLGPLLLAPGLYHLFLFAGPIYMMAEDVIDQAATFEVLAADVHGNGRLPNATQGALVMRSTWTTAGDAPPDECPAGSPVLARPV